MKMRSIRFRLVVWYAGWLVVVFSLLGALMYGGLQTYLQTSLSEAQFRRARQIADTLVANLDQTGEPHVVNEINAWFTPETSDRFIRLTRPDGSLLYLSRNPAEWGFNPQLVPVAHGTRPKGTWRREVIADGPELLIAAVPGHSRSGREILVEVGASMGPVRDVLHRFSVLLGASLAVLVTVAIGGGYFLVRRALAPVDAMSSRAERITMQNLKERLPSIPTGDELERLSISLNHMITRLEEAFEYNQRFIADASHELRTPLTIMRGEMESIVDRTAGTPELQARAATVLEEVVRLARIVEGLFAAARLDAGEGRHERAVFDLAELTTSTTEQMCLLAEDKGIAITCTAPVPVLVEGDRARLKQVVVNLLDNAIKYTPEGGRVALNVQEIDGRACLEVADNGIGIPSDAQAHIFERFFRVDQARSRDKGGAGLGLSIVKAICTAHGGHVEVHSLPGGGSRFRVQLPMAQPASDPKPN